MKDRFRRFAAWVNTLPENYYAQLATGYLFGKGGDWILTSNSTSVAGWTLYVVGWVILIGCIVSAVWRLMKT